MTNKFFRPIAFTSVAIFAATLILTTSRMQARAADSAPPAPAHFWTELLDPAHAPKAQTMPDFVDLAAKLSPAVVNISTDESDEPAADSGDPSPEESPHSPLQPHSQGPLEEFGGTPHAKALGSGFIITKDGYILTNQHVVDSPGKVTVTTQDGRNYIAKIIGHDDKSDIALLKIEAKHDLAVAPLGNSEDLRVGEWVMAIGNPFGFDHSVTAGIVSAKGRFIPGNYEDFIQTDASINPGNSGGPLIDLRGNVIGVNCAIYTHTGASMGIGFAVPIDLVKEELPQLKSSGKVVRGWLGVYIQKVTPELAESLGLADSRGALVAKVLDNGPAKAAGVKRGDVIVAFDNQPVDDSRELPLLVGRTDLGHKGTLKVIRDKQTLDLPVTITQSREPEILASAEKSAKPDLGAVSPFGLHVKDLSADLAKELGLDSPGGVVISSVAPGSRADEAGLRARDVILEVNRAVVKDVDAYQAALKTSSKGKIVLLLVRRGDNTIYVTVKPEA
jgi:serine protease Do